MRIVNLLPKNRQEELRYEAMLRSLWTVCVFSLISFVLVFLVQFGLKIYLEFQAGSIKSQIASLENQIAQQRNTNVKDQITAINNLIADFNSLTSSSPKWSKVIKAFVVLPPAGVRINSFSIDPQTKSISIYGLSPTRELVIELYNNILKDTKNFYGINYPLENVAKPKNIAFHFTFFYNEDLIK